MTKDGDWALESKWRPLGPPGAVRTKPLPPLSGICSGTCQLPARCLSPRRASTRNSSECRVSASSKQSRASPQCEDNSLNPTTEIPRTPPAGRGPSQDPWSPRPSCRGPAGPGASRRGNAARNTCVRVTATRTGHGARRGDETDVRVPDGLSRHEPGRGKRGACTSQYGGPGLGAQGQLGSVTETEVPGHTLR